MVKYPTENSLTINTTHQMLSYLSNDYKRTTATSPTRREEKGVGYDVQLSFALRLQFQYKRPQNIHNSRGVTFKVNGEQVGTLSFRDDTQTPYLACPAVQHRGQLNESLKNCYFVNAHPVSEKTSRLYIPPNYTSNSSEEVTAKIKKGDYYSIPDRAVKTWDELVKGIRNRNLGLPIRKNGQTTSQYRSFVKRLKRLNNLYTDPLRTDGGEDSTEEDKRILNEEAANSLVEFAINQYQEFYEGHEDMPTPDEEREALWQVIYQMDETSDPSVHKIRRSRDVVFEKGNQQSPLELGRST